MSLTKSKWYTVSVVPGRELLVAERIENEHKRKDITGFIRTYSPYEIVKTESEKGVKSKNVALCTGYIFVEVSSPNGIMGIIRSLDGAIGMVLDRSGTPVETRRSEVERFMGKPSEKRIFKYENLQKDELVTIDEGPFSGTEGKFVEYVMENKEEAIVEIIMMNNPVTLTFTTSNLIRKNN